jgi:chromosome partitioning protein
MRTLSIASRKGGVGKTTSAVCLAGALGERGKRVLVVDMDPQASASAWLGVADGGKGLHGVLTDGGKLAELVVASSAPGVDLIPSSGEWLAVAEKVLAAEPGAELVFRRAFEKLPARWDFVLVDCPPTLSLLTVSALAACHEVLAPVEATPFALDGLVSLVQAVEKVRDRLNAGLEVSTILVCRLHARRNLSRDLEEKLRERFGRRVLQAMIRESVALAEASSFGKPVTLYAPTSPGAEDYRSAAAEILNRKKGRTSP